MILADIERVYCCYCGERIWFASKRTKEHLVPLSKGGNNTSYNKKDCCTSCNQDRGNKSYDYWLSELYEKLANQQRFKNSIYKTEAMIENILYWKHYVETAGDKLLMRQYKTKKPSN